MFVCIIKFVCIIMFWSPKDIFNKFKLEWPTAARIPTYFMKVTVLPSNTTKTADKNAEMEA